MTIFLETIDTDSVEVYGGLTACARYLKFSSSDGAAAFRALAGTPDDQKRRLVDATRYIDQQFWQGVATGLVGVDVTTLAFPRSGLTDVTGAPLDATTVSQLVVNAVFEMAALLAADPTVSANVDTGANISSLGAGPAQISFFRASSVADGNATVLPTVVDRLIGRWLAGAGTGAIGAVITGASSHSDFRDRCGVCGGSACSCSIGRRDVTWPV